MFLYEIVRATGEQQSVCCQHVHHIVLVAMVNTNSSSHQMPPWVQLQGAPRARSRKPMRLMVYFSVMALMLADVNSIHFRYKMKKLIISTSDSLHACKCTRTDRGQWRLSQARCPLPSPMHYPLRFSSMLHCFSPFLPDI